MKKLVIIIPALNEEATVGSVIREIPRAIEGIQRVEVVVVSDGSTDRTAEIAAEAGADLVIRHPVNKGLAQTYSEAIDVAIERGADIVVSTDADNHYDQSRIPELIQPVVEGRADVVIGGRAVKTLRGMPWPNRFGNLMGSAVVSRLARLPRTIDVSSGFRAYSRDAAIRVNIFSRYTYTHETILQASQQGLVVTEVVIPARPVNRRSRLIASVPRHIIKSLVTIIRILVYYRPLRFFFWVGCAIFAVGLVFDSILGIHFLRTSAFTPYKILGFIGGSLNLLGILVAIVGLIVDMLTGIRITQERTLYFSKRMFYERRER